MKKLSLIFFGSIVFAFFPMILAVGASLVGFKPYETGAIAAMGILTAPIGLLVAIVIGTRIVVRFFKGEQPVK